MFYFLVVKAHELVDKSNDEIQKQLIELKTELAELRVAQSTGGPPAKVAKIKEVRKGIARCLTVYNQKRRAALQAKYEGKKYIPKDLKPKLTKKIRMRLKADEKYIRCKSGNPNEEVKAFRPRVTTRQLKRKMNFPARVYALRA